MASVMPCRSCGEPCRIVNTAYGQRATCTPCGIRWTRLCKRIEDNVWFNIEPWQAERYQPPGDPDPVGSALLARRIRNDSIRSHDEVAALGMRLLGADPCPKPGCPCQGAMLHLGDVVTDQ